MVLSSGAAVDDGWSMAREVSDDLPLTMIDDPHPDTATPLAGWTALADEIDRLNRTDPRIGLERATTWLEQEVAGGSEEGEVRALRAQTHAIRFLGQFDRAIATYEMVEQRFRAIGLDAEAARTEVGHVTALRY